MDRALSDFLLGLHEALDPTLLFQRVVGSPDPWQTELLRSSSPFTLILASRQIGKSTGIACRIWHMLSTKAAFVIVVAPSERQSRELFRKVVEFKDRSGSTLKAVRSTQTELELSNGGRLVCAPSTSDTIRGYSAVDAIIFDEAAFMDDDLITAVLPMRAETGVVIMATTPNGARGMFYDLWQAGKVDRITARSVDTPRLASKVAFDRKFMPALRFEVEHLCSFVGSGRPFFNPVAVEAAISDEVMPLWAT